MAASVETKVSGGVGKESGSGAKGSGDEPLPNYDKNNPDGSQKVKIICLGDSAVGKSKLVERFLLDGYQPHQLSTYALTLFKHSTTINGKNVDVDFWDTAGQERFNSMHASYYHQAHACILVFDVTRKVTYKNLPTWYQELRQYRPEIPCLCVANKIDVDLSIAKKSFNFTSKNGLPLYFVSASDGSNVVKVFRDAIKAAVAYKNNTDDINDLIMNELENFSLSDSGSTEENKNGKYDDDDDDDDDIIEKASQNIKSVKPRT